MPWVSFSVPSIQSPRGTSGLHPGTGAHLTGRVSEIYFGLHFFPVTAIVYLRTVQLLSWEKQKTVTLFPGEVAVVEVTYSGGVS